MTKNRNIADIFDQASTFNVQAQVGGYVIANTTTIRIGNSTVNTVITPSSFKTNGVEAGSSVGDIIITLDSTMKTGYVELNGATLTNGVTNYPQLASRYSWMVSGSDIMLPDFRGYALRSWAHGSSADPDRGSRSSRAGDGQSGDYPGTYQSHAYYSHNHSATGSGSASTATRGFTAGSGSDSGRLSRACSQGGASTGPNPSISVSVSVSSKGSNETRMRNINVTYQMRVL